MSAHLDPVILKKLQAFARRRRRLIIGRGVAVAVGMLIGTMLVVAGVDFLFPLMSDGVRWGLSAAAYAAVLVSAWRQCLRELWHAPDERQMARLVEHAAPGLREDLLSAVELGRMPGEVFDSAEFRSLLQADVAARMQGLEVKALLPVALIRRSIGATVVIAVTVLGLMTVSENRLRTLFLRALLPGANLENVAGTRLQIIAPLGGDSVVAQGDAVRVVVEARGVPAKTAQLEAQGTGDGRRVAAMKALGGGRFETVIQVGRADVIYRLQAGDGRTKYYTLSAVARPREVAFEKNYHFPDYEKTTDQTVRETHGNLAGLEGTEVELKISVDQPVASGALRVDFGQATPEIPLRVLPDGRLGARVRLSAAGTYRVHLVAARTAFENKFSPEYALRAARDLAPTVELLEPPQDLIAPADELVTLAGRAGDDVGLAQVVQAVRVNDGPWKETVLELDPSRPGRVRRDWELAAEGVRTGDLLTTKLIATDLKGSRAESRSLRITVVEAGGGTERLAALKRRQAWYEKVQALAGAGAILESAAKAAQRHFDQTAADEAGRTTALKALAEAGTRYDEQLTETWTGLHELLRVVPANHEAADLLLLGRVLSLMHSDEGQRLQKYREFLGAVPGRADGRDLARLASERAAGVNALTRLALEADALNLSAEESDVVAELGIVMTAEQERIRALLAAAQTPEEVARVTTRVRTLLSVGKSVDALLEALKGRGGPAAERAQRMQLGLGREADKVEREVDAGIEVAKFRATFEVFAKGTALKAGEAFDLKQRLPAQASKPMQATKWGSKRSVRPGAGTLAGQVAAAWECLEGLAAEQAEVAKMAKLTAAERAALSDERWAAKGDICKARGDFEESRAAADPAFVADLRRATVAVQATAAQALGVGPEKTAERVEVIGQSLRVLESAHRVTELVAGLATLSALERWELRAPQARTLAPRDWVWVATALPVLPEDFRGLGLRDAETRAAFGAAAAQVEEIFGGPASLAVTAEMGVRRKLERVPLSVRREVDAVAEKLRSVLALLTPAVRKARSDLRQFTPPISELARALAKEEAALKTVSAAHAGRAAASSPAANSAEAQPQLARQQALNQRLETLTDLLRADASAPEATNQERRERMRDAAAAEALLRDPPTQAAQALGEATARTESGAQASDLGRAVEQEQKIVNALQQIAGLYQALEHGENVAAARAEWRAKEKDLGIKDPKDAPSARADKLAALAEKSAAELLQELTAKLPANPEMEKELQAIATDTLANAQDQLNAAAKAEAGVAGKVAEQAAKERAGKGQSSALAAAQQAAALARESMAAAEKGAVLAEQAAVKPAQERAKLAVQKAAAAAAAADLAVEAAQKLESAANADQVARAAQAVVEQAEKITLPAQNAQTQAATAAAYLQREVQKPGPLQAPTERALEQNQRAADQAAAAVTAVKEIIAAAKQAAERAQAVAKNPETAPRVPGLAQAASDQQAVAPLAQAAASAVAQAARHEDRLENSAARKTLEDLAGQIAETARKAVPAAAQAVQKAATAGEAQAPVQQASDLLAQQAGALSKASEPQAGDGVPKNGTGEPKSGNGPPKEGSGGPPKPGAGGPPQPGAPPSDTAPASPGEQVAMARLLDLLDSQMSEVAASAAGSTTAPPGPANSATQSALAALLGKSQPSPPRKSLPPKMTRMAESKGGAGSTSGGLPGPLPTVAELQKGDWGKLPPKLAEDIHSGLREPIPSEYREAVETYYRVIAEKSKKP